MINFLTKLLKNEHFSAIINGKQIHLIATKRIMEENQMENYSALDVAKYIISKCTQDGCSISNLQLQKILYFCQGEFYKNHNIPLFKDDIEAWQYGPVIPKVYDRYCAYGASKIYEKNLASILKDPDKEELDPIIEKYRSMKIWDLVDETHKVGTPWAEVYKDNEINQIIPKDMIKNYFSNEAC